MPYKNHIGTKNANGCGSIRKRSKKRKNGTEYVFFEARYRKIPDAGAAGDAAGAVRQGHRVAAGNAGGEHDGRHGDPERPDLRVPDHGRAGLPVAGGHRSQKRERQGVS